MVKHLLLQLNEFLGELSLQLDDVGVHLDLVVLVNLLPGVAVLFLEGSILPEEIVDLHQTCLVNPLHGVSIR
jgi:hypothetical protein